MMSELCCTRERRSTTLTTRTYTITGSGENMWAAKDALHFVWKKVSGDVTITADIEHLGAGGDPHRKAVLMIRQTLDEDSAYVDAAVHGDGLTSLQFRDEKGAATHEVQANVSGPKRVRLTSAGTNITCPSPARVRNFASLAVRCA